MRGIMWPRLAERISRRTVIAGGAIAVVFLALAWVTSGIWGPDGAAAQSKREGRSSRTVPVEVATAEKKEVPIRAEALGTVTPIASVAIKARIESEITAVHFSDGAYVKVGDPLFTLDSRELQAQLHEKEGAVIRNRAALEGAERDERRYTELVSKGATPQNVLDTAVTQVRVLRGQVASDESAVENLKVQIGYCNITAPIAGRASMAAVKVGNFVRPADSAALATIIQSAPVYVSFSLPQRHLPTLRAALAAKTASIEAVIPGDKRRASGRVSMIENTVDATTGMVTVRATMPNEDQVLWPGTLVTVDLTFRHEEAVTVPVAAVQYSQSGPFVFVVADDKARVQPVQVERTVDGSSVITSGLKGGETVVTTGHLLLSDGSRVVIRDSKAGA